MNKKQNGLSRGCGRRVNRLAATAMKQRNARILYDRKHGAAIKSLMVKYKLSESQVYLILKQQGHTVYKNYEFERSILSIIAQGSMSIDDVSVFFDVPIEKLRQWQKNYAWEKSLVSPDRRP